MNRLQFETSPYLLQHAHNPVDWYAWKPEAFERAKKEDKPILVSIGYSTCHWCHVMERESFENENVAAFMNTHFINIKVDREERPDVDQIYMEACQAMSGSGGWPLNCFLTPDGRPFFAGTYYPPRPVHNRPSWTMLLENIRQAFAERRQVVEDQANQLTQMIRRSDGIFIKDQLSPEDWKDSFQKESINQIFAQLKRQFDRQEGGFGGAPKFPGTMSLEYLLEYHFHTGQKEALDHVLLSLDKMIMGGIYDQLGGGFARYATDKAWLVPHFEKMLYDNALLVGLMAKAYQHTGKELYKETIEETLNFIQREMTHPEGGFYSALDADSEGVEGKFYIWDDEEVALFLGEEADLFMKFYDVTPSGNWEGHSILWRAQSRADFCAEHGLDISEFETYLHQAKQKLFEVRSTRIRPGLDDKILLSWNALQVTAYAKAYAALGNPEYKKAAVNHLDFLLRTFLQEDGVSLYHSYKDGKAQYEAFLEDYAFLIEACLEVYNITFDSKWLLKAIDYTDHVLNFFLDKENKLFYFTSENQDDLILRRKDMYDSAQPSGNSTMVRNLRRLGLLTGMSSYRELSIEMLMRVQESVVKYPSSFSRWASALMAQVFPFHEIAVVGEGALRTGRELNALYIPNKVMMASEKEEAAFPLLAGRGSSEGVNIFVCKDYACELPVKTIQQVKEMIVPRHNL